MTGPALGRGIAITLGIVVTFLWATSVVLIRLGLTTESVDPIGFAGVRFTLAALLLLPLALPRLRAGRVWNAGPRSLLEVAFYGLLLFCLAQIAFYQALGELSAATVGLLMGLAPVVTALIVIRSHQERASWIEVIGIAVLIGGVVAYFGIEATDEVPPGAWLAGIAIPLIIGGSARLGRHLAVRAQQKFGGPLGLTAMAMTVGGSSTLVLALLTEGVPSFSARAWLLILWLAAVNTALTYTLWTLTQRTLRAVEASVLADLTVIIIALLGWVVLDETLGLVQVAGLVLALLGVALVQFAPAIRRGGIRLRRAESA